ncbi:AP-4 complex subunit epsilon [Zea mays]|uniref:AP-4 complex subunit epsilon n=1 Tax=Zea mays TaxID=4577 RepID=A0A1D6N3B9_MAIZE|nr:AP-4 complex subunit epsilon [Zea mays]
MPKPSLPLATSQTSMSTPPTDLVPVPEAGYYKEDNQTSMSQPPSDAISGEFGVKLRLDGVQKKWGRPTYSSSTPSSSISLGTWSSSPTWFDHRNDAELAV